MSLCVPVSIYVVVFVCVYSVGKCFCVFVIMAVFVSMCVLGCVCMCLYVSM